MDTNSNKISQNYHTFGKENTLVNLFVKLYEDRDHLSKVH